MTSPEPLRGVNLNLLPVLQALLRHRSVTRAAGELNLTQAAVSNALGRLRAALGDELLVRDGRHMRPTERALRLIDPLETAMAAARVVLGGGSFDPAATRRRFQIATADYVAGLTAPRLSRLLADEAPLASVQFSPAGRSSADGLRAGSVDLVVAPARVLAAAEGGATAAGDFRTAPLTSEPMMCVLRAADLPPDGRLTEAEYRRRPHASFSLDPAMPASIETLHLRERNIVQFDRLLVSECSVLAMIAAAGDCLALVPESLARRFAPVLDLAVVPAPVDVPDIDLTMLWHRRHDHDEGLGWLRGALARSADVTTPPPPR